MRRPQSATLVPNDQKGGLVVKQQRETLVGQGGHTEGESPREVRDRHAMQEELVWEFY